MSLGPEAAERMSVGSLAMRSQGGSGLLACPGTGARTIKRSHERKRRYPVADSVVHDQRGDLDECLPDLLRKASLIECLTKSSEIMFSSLQTILISSFTEPISNSNCCNELV